MRFATLWGEIGDFGGVYLLKKIMIMENRAMNSQSKRGKSLKFDQEWKDAVDRLPKHYRDEICAAIDAYQRDLTVIEVTAGVPRAIFMLIMPTIRRRYRARELQRLARERKAAAKAAKAQKTAKATSSRLPESKQKPAMQGIEPRETSAQTCQQLPSPGQADEAHPTLAKTHSTSVKGKPGKSTLDKLLRHKPRQTKTPGRR